MKTTFLGQGLETDSPNAIGRYLIDYLSSPDFYSFTGISAFASEAGIFGLSEYIESAKKNFKSITLIVGVDQEGTSKEALNEILNLDINGYIFYQKESPIFHPKIYLFEGNDHVKLIIGSSNLTGSGLFTNVENSILIEFDRDEEEGADLLYELKSYYHSLFDFSDPNIFKISTVIIDDFIAKGIVPNELARSNFYSKRNNEQSSAANNGVVIPKRPTSRIPNIFLSKRKRTEGIAYVQEQSNSSEAVYSTGQLIEGMELVWKSGPLTDRDLNTPSAKNTNATGSMLFKKGQSGNIDQRTFFRDVIFSTLPWAFDTKVGSAHLERATAFFHFIIEGVDFGTFPLILTHNTKTDTKTYLQNNSMTWISWGKAKGIIARKDLLKKTASLYKNTPEKNNEYTFVIE